MNAWIWTAIALALGLLALGLSRVLRHLTVFEYQHGVRFVNGRLAGVLAPGSYWIFTPHTRIEVIDARRRVVTVPGQEIMSSDGVSLKLSLLIELAVAEPEAAVLKVQDFEAVIYAKAQSALRAAVGEIPVEDVLRSRAELAAGIHSKVAPEARAIGVDLQSVAVKDIMFPGPLKEAFSQTARAKQEGQAALERARAESAALRNLANASRLLEKNPQLLELRVLQAVSDAGKLVVNLPALGAGAASGAAQTGDED